MVEFLEVIEMSILIIEFLIDWGPIILVVLYWIGLNLFGCLPVLGHEKITKRMVGFYFSTVFFGIMFWAYAELYIVIRICPYWDLCMTQQVFW